MGKADAVLEVLPAVYGATDRHKLLVEVVQALAVPLEHADGELFRIQRAHRLRVAEDPRDIVRLAQALDLEEFHFEDLLQPGVDPDVRLEMMRDRVRRVARLHLDGLGTPWAVVEAAAAFLGAEVVREEPDAPLLRRLDADGYSHIAAIEFAHSPDRPRGTVVLHENPYRRLKVEPAPRWPGDGWDVQNRSVDAGPVRIAIQGVGERTVMPTVFSPGLPGGVVFNGIVPDGETLLIDAREGATLGDVDVTPWLVVYRGGMFDHVDADSATFAVEASEDLPPFSEATEPEESERRRPRPPLPAPPLGDSRWHFTVNTGVYDGDAFDFAVYDPPEAPVGRYDEDPPFDASVFDVDPSGIVGMAWDDRIACSFKLLLPDRVPAPGAPHDASEDVAGMTGNGALHSGRIAAILPRFRAAGVTAFVDAAPDGWVLGRGVLRASVAANGVGVDHHTVRLVDRSSENLVPFDPAALAATSPEEP